MATAPDKPSISATPYTHSIKIDYGLTSFGDPNSGTLSLYKLPIISLSYSLDTQTIVGNYSYTVNTGSSAWSNTRSSYRVIADNGTLTTNSDDVTVVTLPPNFSISGDIIEAFNIGTDSFDVRWHPVALGTEYQVDLYASIDNKSTWTLVAQNIQNATDYTYSFSGLASGTTYTVYTQARDSIGRTSDVTLSSRIPVVTTLFVPKLYGSVNGQTKEIKKLYGSVNGQTKEIKKLYGSVSGRTKRIF